MNRLECLGNIGNLISDLRLRIAKLNEALEKVRSDIGKDSFLSRNSCENIKRTLDEIAELQAQIYIESDALHLKVKGETITAAEALIKEQYEKYQKLEYIKAIEDFVNELHSINEDVEILLNEYRQEFKKIVTTLNLKDQEIQIKKFVVLKDLYETHLDNRLEYIVINKLFDAYPYNLLNQFIIPNAIYLGEKPIIMPAESSPVVEVCSERVEEEVVADIDDEDDGLENTTEAIEAEETVEETVETNNEEERTITIPDSDVVYAGEIEKVFDGTEIVKKAFKAKSVKGELENTIMPTILRVLDEDLFFSIELFKEVDVKDSSNAKFLMDKFVQKGYFKKFELYDEEIYTITEFTRNIFKTKSLISVWKFAHLNFIKAEEIHKNFTKINAWSMIQNLRTSNRLAKELNWENVKVTRGAQNNGFVMCSSDKEDAKKILLLALFDDNVEEVIEEANVLMSGVPHSADYVLVQSSDLLHAKAVAKWLCDNYIDKERLKCLCYYRTVDTGIFDVETDSQIDISDIKVGLYDEADATSDIMSIGACLDVVHKEVVEDVIEESSEDNIEEISIDMGESAPVTEEKDAVIDEALEAEPVEETKDVDEATLIEKSVEVVPNQSEVPVAALSGALSETEEAEYYKKFNDMLMRHQFAAATAYVKALSNRYSKFQKTYEFMAYAINDPMMKCSYNSNAILNLPDVEGFNDDYLFMSAALRCAFSDQYAFDYGLNGLLGFASGLAIAQEVPGILDLLNNIVFFKNKYNHGMDKYAGYRKAKKIDIDKELKRLSTKVDDALKLFKNPVKNAFSRLIETRNIIFGKDSELIGCLNVVAEKNKDKDNLDFVRDYLQTYFIKDDTEIEIANIDNSKIEDFIDVAWDKAREKMLGNGDRSSKLMSGFRNSLISQINTAIEILIEYCNVLNEYEDNSENDAAIFYKSHENEIASKASNVIKQLRTLHKAGNGSSAVLIETINELLERMDGTYDKNSYKYFYKDLLKTKYVLLNDAYLPYLLDVDDSLPEMSPIRRIEQHVNAEQKTFEERLKSILYDEEDNFGSIDLILGYLNETFAPDFGSTFKLENNYDGSLESAMKALDYDAKNFVEKLELSHSYGQILEPAMKENILQNAEVWLERAKEMKNLGLYKEITKAYLSNIARNALYIGQLHQASLEDYKRVKSNWQDDANIAKAVATIEKRIQQQNYSAAEDLLNCLVNDEVFEEETSDYVDHFQNFLRDYSYNYSEASNMRGNFTQILGKRLGHKDKKGAELLNKSWILSTNHLNESKVKDLLQALRFDVDAVVRKPLITGGIHNFVVSLKKPEDGRKKNYSHPIAAFGSKAENEQFRVAFIFGNEGERALLEKFKAIGEAMPTLLFLDSALSEASRRTIARKAKEEFGQIFAVVDRVVFSYLVNNFTETAVQQMLMAITMPYTYYQPYVFSSQNAIPPEMFIGRREELRKILDPAGVNIVYGGRQLGKSALLKKALADVDHNETNHRAVYVDVNRFDYNDAAEEVYKKLCNAKILPKRLEVIDWENVCQAIFERMTSDTKEKIPFLLLLIDEADEFIASSASVKYKPIEDLKRLQESLSGRFKFVMAGLRNVVRFDKALALGNNSVLAHLTSLTVKPFKVSEARELFEKPLFYLGFRLNKDEKTSNLLASIFSNTNYFPGLIQLYCANLIESLKKKDYAGYAEADTPPYILSETHVQKILGENELQTEIKSKFFITLTLDNDEDNYYMLIALLVAYKYHEAKSSNIAAHEGCTPKDILKLANDFNVMRFRNFTEENMYALMEEMKELNVFQAVGNNGYRFSRYNFLHMMGTEEEVINAIEQATL